MTVKANQRLDDLALWNKNPHGVAIRSTLDSVKQNMEAVFNEERARQESLAGGSKDSDTILQRWQDIIRDVFTDDEVVSDGGKKVRYLHSASAGDTSVGGMDAINPHWSFGVDDDICYPVHSTEYPKTQESSSSSNRKSLIGLGRVYHETYFINQKNIYMSFGVPQFYNLADFLQGAVDTEHAELHNQGSPTVFSNLKEMVDAKLLSFGLTSSVMKFWHGAGSLFKGGGAGSRKITKYYGMRPAMPIYYRMVNSIMSILAVNMNLYGDQEVSEYLQKHSNSSGNASLSQEGYPDFLEYGPDIYAMLDKRRHQRIGDNRRTTDQMINKSKKLANTDSKETTFLDWMSNIWSDSDALAHNLMRYVAFRIETGTGVSETISNQTGQSNLASTINSKAAASRDKVFNFKAAVEGDSAWKQAAKAIPEMIRNLAKSTATEALGVLITGNGYIDIPDVWKGSTFSKTVSFDLKLRAKSGDKISIFQSIYVPLCMLLAGATPRGIGANAYTQPFLLEAYSAGLHSVPLGMIDSLSIKRGDSEFAWTYDNLPTAIDVTVNIKDLTPVMFLSLLNINSQGLVDSALESNVGMVDYLNTLSGLPLADRTHKLLRLKRLRKSLLLVAKNTVFNPMAFSHTLANSAFMRLKATLDTRPWYTPNR